MPQLDPSSFASQLFWLAITFSFLYVIMARFTLPRIASVLQTRQEKIANDLENAASLKEDAEGLEADYTSSIEETRRKANALISEASAKVTASSAKKHLEHDKALLEKALEAEKRIADARAQAINEISTVSSDLCGLIVKKILNVKVTKKQTDSAVKKVMKAFDNDNFDNDNIAGGETGNA